MKFYTVSNWARSRTLGGLLTFGIFLASIISWFFADEMDSVKLSLTWLLRIAEITLFLFPLIVFVSARFFWRLPFINTWFGVPDLNGTWIGTLERISYPDVQKETGVPVIYEIEQTYFRMRMRLINTVENTHSGITRSVSAMTAITGDFEAGFEIRSHFQLSTGFGVEVLSVRSDQDATVLEGSYVSDFPRKGKIIAKRILETDKQVIAKITELTSRTGERYLGTTIPRNVLTPYIIRMKSFQGEDKLDDLLANRKKRDGDAHHLTLVSPPEFSTLSLDQIAGLVGKEIRIILHGLGTNGRDGATIYYATASTPHGNFYRDMAGLPEKDFHITLGFSPHDVYDVVKDQNTQIWPVIDR